MTSLLEVRGVEIGGRLRSTDLQVFAGQMVAVIGPNGGGKTSLLRACAAIEGSSGSIRVDGEDLRKAPPSRRSRLLGYLPASRDLVWPISVRDLISLGLASPDPTRVDELIALLELEPLASRPVDRLSTGERARVLLGRALAPQPQVLLLDEPLSNLDPYWVLRLLQLLREIARQGAAVLVALHDIERITAFNRVLLVRNGQVCADLPPEEMISAAALQDAFRIERGSQGWQVRRPADPQSSQ
jgi:iron complex transport system ATP-binding protein